MNKEKIAEILMEFKWKDISIDETIDKLSHWFVKTGEYEVLKDLYVYNLEECSSKQQIRFEDIEMSRQYLLEKEDSGHFYKYLSLLHGMTFPCTHHVIPVLEFYVIDSNDNSNQYLSDYLIINDSNWQDYKIWTVEKRK